MSAPATIGLFEGYGGLTMAVKEVFGAELVAYSEVDPAASKILAHHHPDVPNLGDVTAIDWSAVHVEAGRLLILTGGFPCQDLSLAGLGAGLRPGTRSGLWSHMAYAIDQLRPDLVVIENVRGLLSADAACDLEPCPWCLGDDEGRPLRALGAVLGDLADLRYDAVWIGLRAADVGAPHPRFRVFVLAWPAADTDGARSQGRGVHGPAGPAALGDGAPAAANWGEYGPAIRRWELILGRPAPAPTQTGAKGGQQLSPLFVEWLMGLPEGWVTDPAIGLTRNDQLARLGNGVVPQQAAAALRHLLAANVEAVAA